MRETLARIAVLAVVVLLVALAGAVAWRDSSARASRVAVSPSGEVVAAVPEEARPAVSAAQRARGAALFEEQRCRGCHSLSGQGNPGLPLDDVGLRHGVTDMPPWITGVGLPADALSPAVRRRKASYGQLPPEDLAALVAFLSEQRSDPP